MKNNENLQTSSTETRYIPMEVTNETIEDFGIDKSKVEWSKIGNKRVKVIKVPATEEEYSAYMRPLWREEKRQQRHSDEVSSDQLYEENEYEFADPNTDIEGDFTKKELIRELRKSLAELEELDRIIIEMFAHGSSEYEIGQAVGMSQRGVGKRKQRILLKLRICLEDYR